ncbi:MAG: hypothetical protein F2793_09275 [Actinobacteria bacterium]|nr:hypothetical protein [Actinomycetota bacterium]
MTTARASVPRFIVPVLIALAGSAFGALCEVNPPCVRGTSDTTSQPCSPNLFISSSNRLTPPAALSTFICPSTGRYCSRWRYIVVPDSTSLRKRANSSSLCLTMAASRSRRSRATSSAWSRAASACSSRASWSASRCNSRCSAFFALLNTCSPLRRVGSPRDFDSTQRTCTNGKRDPSENSGPFGGRISDRHAAVRDTSPMKHLHMQLTFGQDTVTQPVIYEIVKRFDVIPNIRRAAIENHVGWMILDLAGEAAALDSAIAHLRASGVEVAPAEGDVLAG